MKNCWRIAGSVLVVLSFWAAAALAETRYISDQLIVSLREKPQGGAQSITYLKTDTPVEVLEETGDFLKVKTQAGETGYIQKNYLTAETPRSVTIKQLQQERDRLTDKVEELKRQIATAASRGDQSQQELVAQLTESNEQASQLQKSLEESQAALTRTSQEFQTLQNDAKEVVTITSERDQLRQTNQELTTAVAKLEQEVKDLTVSGLIKWFLAGAAVLLIGWIIGKYSGGRRRSRF
jgi:SH3 domain protein